MAVEMTPEMRAMYKRYVETWKAAGPELDEIQTRELQELDARVAIHNLFGDWMPASNPARRETSGLVEQQALFAKLRL